VNIIRFVIILKMENTNNAIAHAIRESYSALKRKMLQNPLPEFYHRHHPTRLSVFLNPSSPSIVSRIDTPGEEDRFQFFDRPCALGTSSNPLEREALRLLFPTITAMPCAVGGGESSARDEEREVCGDSFEENDVCEMVGTRVVVGIGCLYIRKMGYLSFFEPIEKYTEGKEKGYMKIGTFEVRFFGEWGGGHCVVRMAVCFSGGTFYRFSNQESCKEFREVFSLW
jgi:hypothetical protein